MALYLLTHLYIRILHGKMDELPDVNEKLNAKEDIKNDYMDSI